MPVFRQWTVVLTALTLAGVANSAPPSPTNPLVGSWELRAEGSSCVETQRFDADGHGFDSGGQEVSESVFEISATPSEKGFYKVTDTIVKTNGKPDCSGSITPLGDRAIFYIRVEDQGNAYLLCMAEELTTCIGIARRVASVGT